MGPSVMGVSAAEQAQVRRRNALPAARRLPLLCSLPPSWLHMAVLVQSATTSCLLSVSVIT